MLIKVFTVEQINFTMKKKEKKKKRKYKTGNLTISSNQASSWAIDLALTIYLSTWCPLSKVNF